VFDRDLAKQSGAGSACKRYMLEKSGNDIRAWEI
jgi:hypothetical protein